MILGGAAILGAPQGRHVEERVFLYIDRFGCTIVIDWHNLERRPASVENGETLAPPVATGASMRGFLDSLPDILAGRDLRALARAISQAHRGDRTFLMMIGAHPIKVGLSPIICGLLRDGILSAIATNGAAIIHD